MKSLCPPLLALAVATAGCGNFSNEDLVFLAALPKPREVELRVQQIAPTRGALTSADTVGEDAAYYRLSSNLAANLNLGVGELLKLVDSLGKGYPPTERTDDARIWGPVEDVDGKGFTIRLEIRREVLAAGAPRFHFCLAAGPDEEITGAAARCGEPDQNGFATILAGFYDPKTPEGGARSGAGEITLDFEASLRAGTGKPEERGLLTLSYDFSQGGDSKQIHVDFVKPVDFGTLTQTMVYDYGRTAEGQVDFAFLLTNFIDENETNGKPQDATIDATWIENVAGRADGTQVGGDLDPGQHAVISECWDALAKRTYARIAVFRGDVEEAVLLHEGDPASCL